MASMIYVADDDENIRNIVCAFLEKEGYQVVSFSNGDDLYDMFCKVPADLVVLDIMMPGSSGLDICQKLRNMCNVPIILLTAKDTESDYITGINLGSDDYIAKPFRPTILVMRVKALLRRSMLSNEPIIVNRSISFGTIEILEKEHEIKANSKVLDLTPKEYAVLQYLVTHSHEAVSREKMLDEIWGFSDSVETRVTDETVRKIRKKVSETGCTVTIKNIWGYGYKLEEGQN